MRYLLLLSLASCASIRTGATRQLEDGRMISIQVVHEAGDYAPCVSYVREAKHPDTVVLNEDSHCPDLDRMLAHEIGHANGHVHEEGGIMMPIQQEVFIQR